MRKEMLAAIFFGLAVGLFLTYGFYRARLAMLPHSNQSASPSTSVSPSASPTDNGQLTILSPVDETVQAETKTTISGKTLVNATVVIFVNDDEAVTTADGSGNFSQERQLKARSNVISVNVLDDKGNKITAERTVIVANTDSLNPSPDATPAGQKK